MPFLSYSQEVKEDIIGKSSRIELQNDTFFGPIFKSEYINYSVENEVLSELKASIYSYQITIVMATWCGDSKEQVPRFIKVLDKLDYDTKRLNIICVDYEKMAKDTGVEKLNIQKVPTFIIFDQKGSEVGRIIETPETSLEGDLLNIIKSKLALF